MNPGEKAEAQERTDRDGFWKDAWIYNLSATVWR